MAYVSKGFDYLSNITKEELLKLYKKEKDSKACIRLLCAIHRKDGKSLSEIGEILYIPTSTVSDHLRRLSIDFSNLYDKHNQQRPYRLTQREHELLINAIKNSPEKSGYPAIVWTTKMILHYIKNNFGKNFTEHGLRKLLYRANFVLIKPRPYNNKGNKKQQEEFKKNFPKILNDICKMDMRSSLWMSQDSYYKIIK